MDVGVIRDPCRLKSVEWKIRNYFVLPQRANTLIDSPTFHFSNASFFLRIYPNGQRCDNSVEFMGLYLAIVNSEDEYVPVKFTMGIKTIDGDVYHQIKHFHRFNYKSSGTQFGCSKFTKRLELCRNQFKVSLDGALTVFLVANNWQSASDAATQTVSVFGSEALSRDFHSLLQNEHKTDVTIKVENQSFRAHRQILGARSSVFAAMFEHDMKENSSGVVHIQDCDPHAFRDFLAFIYSGKAEKLCIQNVSQLFMLSDKYDLCDLKEMCVNFMKENLCIDIACDVVCIADKHCEEELRQAAKELIIKNIKTLLPTQQWISFMRDNPLMAAEFLMTVIPDTES